MTLWVKDQGVATTREREETIFTPFLQTVDGSILETVSGEGLQAVMGYTTRTSEAGETKTRWDLVYDWFNMNGYLPFTYPGLLYNESDIDHGTSTIPNQGTDGGSLVMNGFNRDNASVSGGVTIADDAMMFDGVDGYITIPNTIDWSSIDWSIACEITFNSDSSDNNFISQKDGAGTGRTILYRETSNNKRGTSIGGTVVYFSSLDDVVIGATQRIVLTKSGTTLKLYDLNGNESKTLAMESSNGDFVIGANKVLNNSFLNGNIKYIRLYNKALSPIEVAQEQASVTYSTITDGSLVGQWTGRDYSGTEESPTIIYDTNMISSIDPSSGKKTIIFDGNNDFITVSNNLDYRTFDWSMSFNVTFNQLTWNPLIAQPGKTYLLVTNTSFWRTGIGGVNVDFTQISKVALNENYKVILVKEGDQLTLIVNDEQETITVTDTSNDGDFWVGQSSNANTWLNGLMGEIRIYNKALTYGEIQRIKMGLGPK